MFHPWTWQEDCKRYLEANASSESRKRVYAKPLSLDQAGLLGKLPTWSLWTPEHTGYSGWENNSRPMITATVNVQHWGQTTDIQDITQKHI